VLSLAGLSAGESFLKSYSIYVLAGFASFAVAGYILARLLLAKGGEEEPGRLNLESPFSLKTALKALATFAAILTVAAAATKVFRSCGTHRLEPTRRLGERGGCDLHGVLPSVSRNDFARTECSLLAVRYTNFGLEQGPPS